MNKISITGRITKDIDIRKTQNGRSVVELFVAVQRERKNQNGEYPVDFFKVVCWEQKAEYLNSYAKKGTLLGITGRLETNSYQNQEGKRITDTFIQAEQVEILNQPQSKDVDSGVKSYYRDEVRTDIESEDNPW